MRYWPILLIVAVLAIGATLPTTQPGIIINGWLVQEPGPGQVLVLRYDPSGTYVTGADTFSQWDGDRDGDVDLDDYALFAAAYTGPQ